MGSGASTLTDQQTKALEDGKALLGEKLLKGGDEIDIAEAFKDKKAVALYFSAHWCPPCRGFTPKLAEFYKSDLKEKGLEIIFVSSDKDEEQFKAYFSEMPWLALPYSARDLKDKLNKKYKVQGIPSLIILNAEDGSLITSDGRSAVMNDPKGEKLPWIPPTFKEALGEKFLKVSGDSTEEVGLDTIAGKTLGLYFSAHWCPPCRGFTPELAKWYKGVKTEVGDKFEIIFVSGDQEEKAMKDYFKEQADAGGDWLCLPFAAKDNLDSLFEIQGIPTFLIVDPDGKVINKSGRSLVPSATAADFPWTPPAIADIESPDDINETPSLVLFLDSCSKDVQDEIIKKIAPIAEEYAKADPQELAFYASRTNGRVAAQIRGMCGIESSAQSFKKESSAPEGEGSPKLIRTISSATPTIVLLDIPDEGGYYVGKMAKEMDGSGVKKFIADYKDKKLERKQLS